jgi:hypothetical protein
VSGLLTPAANLQQQHPRARWAGPQQQHRFPAGRLAASVPAAQPHENPGTGWTASAAANTQETTLGKCVDEYTSMTVLIASRSMVSPFIGPGNAGLDGNRNGNQIGHVSVAGEAKGDGGGFREAVSS